jgi:hypothetical protein
MSGGDTLILLPSMAADVRLFDRLHLLLARPKDGQRGGGIETRAGHSVGPRTHSW